MSKRISTAATTLSLPGVLFITGGASGLGAGIALAFADLGARGIVLADLNEALGKQVCDKINATYPGVALNIRTDVSNEEDVKNAVAFAVEKFGRVDYAINSAGIVVGGNAVTTISQTDLKDYDRIQNVDARGVFISMKHELRQMLKQTPRDPSSPRSSRGVIINVASRASLEGVPKFGSYCTAKHAVLGMSRVAAVEHAKDLVRVIALCPGLISTPGHVKAAKEVDDMLLAKVPAGRFGVVDEITDAVTWVCTDGASYMTGCTLEIDGGCAAL